MGSHDPGAGGTAIFVETTGGSSPVDPGSANRNALPCLHLCTGYSKKISENEAMESGIKALVVKPIVKADLAKAVRQVLDQALSKP